MPARLFRWEVKMVFHERGVGWRVLISDVKILAATFFNLLMNTL